MKLCTDIKKLNHISGREVVAAWGQIDGYRYKDRGDCRCSLINQVSRATIRAMRPCYLVKINRYKKDEPFITEYKRGMVYNFGACLALPVNDPELLKMLEEYGAADYTEAMQRISAIYDRAAELGGQILSWD